ncbi:hypothetical protein [Paraliomyxa miuraensis]|uniref:hypothetical protein n=1 Tax=Paraliomyxa miuraensis TaxID=376150 RepID=UPI00225BFCB7|nr:hypothetical protein [Paraliomyxa miuraensis]MCX4240156.1 hypothetical protein [Paraliomyxa miuraensis]
MATPTFITFSRFRGNLLEAVERVENEVCPQWHCRLDRALFLRPSSDPYDGGITTDGELEPCTSVEAVAELARTGKPLGLAYIAYPTRANFYLEFFDISEDGYSLAASIESSILYHKDDEYESCRWFEGWLISLVVALRPSVCAYGNTEIIDPNMEFSKVLEGLRRVRYKALDPAQILERLRTGDLLELPDPVFHAISIDLIETPEIRTLMKTRPQAPGLEYKVAPGYHVLSNLRGF